MGFKNKIEQEHNEIINNLKQAGYANKTIQYSDFLKIYEPYKSIMSELEFAYLLGINYEKFRSLRSKGTKTKILVQTASSELKETIINKLRSLGYTNRKINYSEFLELYKEYSTQITEKDFSEIIGITYSRYRNIKNKGNKTTILPLDIDANKIRNEIQRKYGSNILIDYEKFLELYKPYKSQLNSESTFAEILGITIGNFSSMKNLGTKAKILKPDNASEDLKVSIRTSIINQGYEHKLIDYSEFLLLYKPYSGTLTELHFARILGITSTKYNQIRFCNTRTYVFGKAPQHVIDIDSQKGILDELISTGYSNRKIQYPEFLQIYEKYKSKIDELQFANLIGISYSNFMSLKHQKNGVIILKTDHLSDEQLQKISVDEKIKAITGQYIGYSQFLELYATYSNFMTELQFAEAIGISPTSYHNLKSGNVKVDKLYSKRIRIKYITSESRVYSESEIADFCKKYDCNMRDFLKIMCHTENEELIDEYYIILQTKGIFVGDVPIDNAILEIYGDTIINFINTQCELLGRIYKQSIYCDDIASDTIFYITQKCGHFFNNFDKDRAVRIIKIIAKKYITYLYRSHLRLRNFSLDQIDETLSDHHTYTLDKTQNTESSAIDNIKNASDDIYDACINLLQYYYNLGFSRSDTIAKVSQDLNLTQDKMLEIMTQYLLNRNKVKQTSSGEYYLR